MLRARVNFSKEGRRAAAVAATRAHTMGRESINALGTCVIVVPAHVVLHAGWFSKETLHRPRGAGDAIFALCFLPLAHAAARTQWTRGALGKTVAD